MFFINEIHSYEKCFGGIWVLFEEKITAMIFGFLRLKKRFFEVEPFPQQLLKSSSCIVKGNEELGTVKTVKGL